MSDINNMNLRSEVVTYDPEAEYNTPLTVPDDTYFGELSLGGTSGVTIKEGRNGNPSYVECFVVGRIIAPGSKLDGKKVGSRQTSQVFANSHTSAIHQMFKAVGSPLPARATLGEILDATTSLLQSSPQCNFRTRWEASIKNVSADGSELPKEQQYLRQRGMRNFPQRSDGSYDPFTTFTLASGDTVQVEGRPAIVDFQPARTTNGAHGA